MDDPFVSAFALVYGVAFLVGVPVGWKMRPVALGCLGIGVLLIAAIVLLNFLYSHVAYFRDDEWAALSFLFCLVLIGIVWLASLAGWFVGWAVQATRASEAPTSRDDKS